MTDSTEPLNDESGEDPNQPPPDEAPDELPTKGVSAKQLAANRANAQRSTGPGPDGKQRSSQNATKAGYWAKQLHPIPAGPFSEDSGEFFAGAEALIATCNPRDAHESMMAKRVASALIRLDRADRYEAALMLETTDLDEFAKAHFTDPEPLEDALHEVDRLIDHVGVLAGRQDRDENTPTWAWLALDLRKHGPDPKIEVDEAWTKDLTPSTDEAWKSVTFAIFKHFWDDEDKAFQYLVHRRMKLELKAGEARRRFDAMVAKRHVALTTDIVDRPRSAAWTEYQRAIKALQALQERELPDDA